MLAGEQPATAAGLLMQGEAESPESVGLRAGRATSSLSSMRVSGLDWGTKPTGPRTGGCCRSPHLPESMNP